MVIKWNFLVVLLCIVSSILITLLFKSKVSRRKLFLLNLSIFLIGILLLLPNIYTRYKVIKYGWAVDFINYDSIHNYSLGNGQKIALIDSGISEFQFKQVEEHISLTNSKVDNNGHGTMIMSIIKGFDKKVKGIAPNTQIISIQIADSEGHIKADLVVDAIKLAIENKCTIINLSFGTYVYNNDIYKVIQEALMSNITVVASSGDYRHQELLFPSSIDEVVSVGAISEGGEEWYFSNGKEHSVINAPGDRIKAINKEGKVVVTTGTSQSTGLISGYIALLRAFYEEQNILYSNEEIIQTLNSISNKHINYLTPFIN